MIPSSLDNYVLCCVYLGLNPSHAILKTTEKYWDCRKKLSILLKLVCFCASEHFSNLSHVFKNLCSTKERRSCQTRKSRSKLWPAVKETLGIMKSSYRCTNIQVSMSSACAVIADLLRTGALAIALAPGERVEMRLDWNAENLDTKGNSSARSPCTVCVWMCLCVCVCYLEWCHDLGAFILIFLTSWDGQPFCNSVTAWISYTNRFLTVRQT